MPLRQPSARSVGSNTIAIGSWMRGSFAWRRSLLLVLAAIFFTPNQAASADLATTELLYRSGKYDQAAEIAREQVERGIWNERWSRLLIQAHLARGRHDEALQVYRSAIRRYSSSLTLRLLGAEVMRANDMTDEAQREMNTIFEILRRSPSRYASRDNLIAAGRYFAHRGEDAREVLRLFFDRVREADPDYLEAYIATAELALRKGDFKVAAETLDQAELVDGSDPRVFYLMAKAWQPSDPQRANAAIQRALEMNPQHVDSLLLQAEHAVDRELYESAESLIRDVLLINPHEPRAWAYMAVIAHLRGRYEIEQLMRAAALSTWSENPEVDHLIGRKLSDKYRFEEGAAYQRQALMMDAHYAPANFQLAQDLLRLGEEEIGWELARRVAEEDEYNVVAHNLVTLYDHVKHFSVLQQDGIHVRMDPREASIYGEQVLELLTEARESLCAKYDVDPDGPILVEIFPDQSDFAIRTFGLPGGAGFLGVCFGRVVTANSPASQGARPANWQSVLWHEFCHVVTLSKSNNRMPRWLSEGISVYEERERDPSWGEKMIPAYRHMILGDDLTPVSRLSGAFLTPESPLHLQFAYYQSSLVVEFLVEAHGLDAVKSLLRDLGDGLLINDALTKNVGSLQKLDATFAEYARQRAKSFGAQADWSKQGVPEENDVDVLQDWLTEHPNNYWALRKLASALIAAEQYEQALEPLEKIRELGAISGERGGPLEQLTQVYRELRRTPAEREAHEAIVARSSDALPSLTRLIELSHPEASPGNSERTAEPQKQARAETKRIEQWQQVQDLAERFLAVNPLIPTGHEYLAVASEALQQPEVAIDALKALALMEPIDPAALHYRTARAYTQLQQTSQAKRQVLMALEDAPRYRDALRLLLKVSEPAAGQQSDAPKLKGPVAESEDTFAEPTPAVTEVDSDPDDELIQARSASE